MWFKELWIRTKEVAVTYTGTFIVVMFLNQLLFFGFCLNPICLIAAMPHCLAITVVIGTLLDRWNKSGKEKEEKEEKTIGTELKEKRSYYLESKMANRKEMEALLKSAGIKPEELNARMNAQIKKSVNPLKNHTDFNKNIEKFIEPDPISNKLTDPNLEKKQKNLENGLPARSHFPWSDAEINMVSKLYDSGKSLIVLSQMFERSHLGIAVRLTKIGKISERELVKIKNTDKKRKEIEKHFEKHKRHPYLYYITHKQNIESILENGILNFYEAKKLNTNHIDISHPEVQNKREKVEEHYSRKIHEYTPLYFNPKNPMSRLRWNDYKNALCFLQVSVSALADGEFLISDGNAASPVTKFYKSLDQLDLLPWDVINAKYWNDLDDGSRKRCAEVLIYPKIKPEHIKSIFCFSIDTKNYLDKFGIKTEKIKEIF